MFPTDRPRRLRSTPALRRLVSETEVRPRHLVLPVFLAEGIDAPRPITSMPGVVQHTVESLRKAAAGAAAAGLGGIMLFGVPARRDATGSGALDPDGVLNVGLREVRAEVGDALPVMADTCLDEFTDHGHCGVLAADGSRDAQRSGAGPVEEDAQRSGAGPVEEDAQRSGAGPVEEDAQRSAAGPVVDNDATLDVYDAMAVAQAEAGAHIVAPSGMMDGQVGRIRAALDAAGHSGVAVLAYSAKYASAFYGPFREAVDSQLVGDRRTYQQDPANAREALRETSLDLAEGADMVMVKPAMAYLDVLRSVAEMSDVPVAAYQVSGEYAMISAAAERGWIDLDRTVLETVTGIRRAGADIVLTYWAAALASRLDA